MDGPIPLTLLRNRHFAGIIPNSNFLRAVCLLKCNGTCRCITSSRVAGALPVPRPNRLRYIILDTNDMITRRNFIRSLIAAAGTTVWTQSVSAGLSSQIADNLCKSFLSRLSPAEYSRLLHMTLYALRREAALKGAVSTAMQMPSLSSRYRDILLPDPEIDSDYTIYYGDPHGHTKHSDGMRTARAYYEYAQKMGLDFAVLTDHAEILSPREWQSNQHATDNAYIPGSFVTLQAYEYTNCIDGNYDIYLLTDTDTHIGTDSLYAWHNFFVWRPREYTNDNFVENPTALFTMLKQAKSAGVVKDVMAVPHHCSWSLAPTNWSYFDPEIVFFAEGYSKHGNSVFPDWFEDFCDKIPYYQEGTSVLDALNRNIRIGITAATDTHGGMPGSLHHTLNLPVFCYTGGLTGVLVKRNEPFTRQTVWDALRQRRVFGTRVLGLHMSFKVNGQEMGSTVRPDTEPCFYIEVHSPETEEILGIPPMIRYIEIIKNGSIVFKHWLLFNPYHVRIEAWKDPDFNDRIDNSYFLRVVGYAGDLAWSSPVFIEKSR